MTNFPLYDYSETCALEYANDMPFARCCQGVSFTAWQVAGRSRSSAEKPMRC